MEEEESYVETFQDVSGEKDHQRHSEDVSELVSVGGFKAGCSEVYPQVSCDPLQGASRQEVATYMGVTDEVFQQVETSCRVEHLFTFILYAYNLVTWHLFTRTHYSRISNLLSQCGNLDAVMKIAPKDIPKDSLLKSIRNPSLVKELMDKHGLAMNAVIPAPTSHTPPANAELTETPEVILSVLVFHPQKKRRDLEYLVLGSQSLTELKDNILCFSDYYVETDYSEDPDSFDRKKSPPWSSPSAYFFINNTFYNDLRHPLSTDLSRPIREWSERENRLELAARLEQFSTADMATTRFDQLTLRLGYPYLYCHHDNCEHLIIFKDLRMLHSMDSQSKRDYPKLVYRHRGRRRKCHVCDVLDPTWVTCSDELATESPCLFCEECFKKLHYSKEGKKVCNFEAYPIYPDVIS